MLFFISCIKANRTNHIVAKLLSSWKSYPSISNHLNCSWELSHGHWKIKWFEGDITLKSFELITADESNVVDDGDNDKAYFIS